MQMDTEVLEGLCCKGKHAKHYILVYKLQYKVKTNSKYCKGQQWMPPINSKEVNLFKSLQLAQKQDQLHKMPSKNAFQESQV